MELIKREFNYYNPILKKRILHDESSDMIVPDTYPDMAKFIGAAGHVLVKEVTVQNGRMLISGTIKTAVFYMPEGEEKPRILEMPISFAHIEDIPNIETSATANVASDIVSLEPSMQNPRKLTMKACITLNVSAYGKKTLNLTTDVISDSNEHVEVCSQKKSVTYPENISQKSFNVLETVDLGDTQPANICLCRPSVKADDIRILAGKVIVKGTFSLNQLICDVENAVSANKISTQFTQIVEIDGINSDNDIECEFCVKDIDFQRDKASDGNNFDLRASLDMLIKVSKTESISVINDIFSTRWETETEVSNEKIGSDVVTVPMKQSIKESFDAENVPESVLMCSADLGQINIQNNEISAEVFLSAWYTSGEQGIGYAGKTTTVKFTADNPTPENISIDVQNIKASVSEGKISIDGEVVCEVIENSAVYTTNLESAKIFADRPNKNTRQASVILRYASKGEKIWDTAKEYCSSVSEIEQVNAISDEDNIEQGRLLLIPLKK